MNEVECIEDTLAYLRLVRPVDIVVVDGGVVCGVGAHAELLESNSVYRHLVQRQLTGTGASEQDADAKSK